MIKLSNGFEMVVFGFGFSLCTSIPFGYSMRALRPTLDRDMEKVYAQMSSEIKGDFGNSEMVHLLE